MKCGINNVEITLDLEMHQVDNLSKIQASPAVWPATAN